LSCGRREQEKGQNKQASRDVGQLCVVHARNDDALKSNQDYQAITKDIVVECAEELGREEWCEAPLAQERKLARSRQESASLWAAARTIAQKNCRFRSKLRTHPVLGD